MPTPSAVTPAVASTGPARPAEQQQEDAAAALAALGARAVGDAVNAVRRGVGGGEWPVFALQLPVGRSEGCVGRAHAWRAWRKVTAPGRTLSLLIFARRRCAAHAAAGIFRHAAHGTTLHFLLSSSTQVYEYVADGFDAFDA